MPIAITQADMEAVFTVTDALEIHREAITVPLRKRDPGSVRRLSPEVFEIVLPESVPAAEWLPTLRAELERLR